MSQTGELDRAFTLIEAEQLDEARTILDGYLLDYPDSADAWWLYAHAVEDPAEARSALNNVLRLNPTYPGARALLNELNTAVPAPAAAGGIRQLGGTRPTEAAPDFLDELEDESAPFETVRDRADEDEFDDFEVPVSEERRAPRWVLPLIALVAALILIVGLVVILRPGGLGTQVAADTTPTPDTPVTLPDTDPEPTDDPGAALATTTVDDTGAVDTPTTDTGTTADDISSPFATATVPSSESTADVVVESPNTLPTATTEPETADQGIVSPVVTDPNPEAVLDEGEAVVEVGTGFEALYAALADYEVVPDSGIIEATDMGSVLRVDVCSSAELEALTTNYNALYGIAQASGDVTEPYDAVGVRLLRCDTDEVLRFITASAADAQAYRDDQLSDDEFRSRWTAR